MSTGIKLTNAKYLNDYKVELHFSDDTVRQIDFGGFLSTHSHPQWNRFKKLNNFCKFRIDRGNLVWGRNWDLVFDIFELYDGKNPT